MRGWIALLILAVSGVARADLRASWLDPTWHYRVPVSLPAATAVGSTETVDVDFGALITQLGINGTFDTNSYRVTRPDGTTLVTLQQWTDARYGSATDATGNSRGELRFIAQDAGAQTYYLYFDITANGAKAANPQTPINGNFEFGGSGTATPPGWSLTTTAGFDAQIRPSENPSITTDGTTAGNGTPPKTTDGTPLSGAFSYLMGARSANEPGAVTQPAVTLNKTIAVPASGAGNVVVRYRPEGWDSGANGSTNYDFIRISVVSAGGVTTELVGPTAGNYTTLPFSPNLGTQAAANNRSGYGQYNGFDTDTNGNHRSGMAIARGSEVWFTLSSSLATYAGTTVTLRISSNHTNQYRSWFSIDDVEWSLQTATVTASQVQAFGVNVTAPNDTAVSSASQYQVGQVLTIRAAVQATTIANGVTADVINPSGTVVATGVQLYDDGTHGDAVAGDRIFSNNGSVAANPTYTFLSSDTQSAAWTVRVYARDSSTSTTGATNGRVHISGQPNSPQNQADYWNIDDQVFSLVTVNLVILKSVATISDPIDGTTRPKSIPGAIKEYTITVTNQGAGASDANTIKLADAIPSQAELVVTDIGGAGSGPVLFTQGSPTSGLTYTFTALNNGADSLEFSNNGGTTWTYSPTANGNGTDPAVTNIRISPTGAFAGKSGVTAPSFTIQFRIRIK
ncbi:MAG TPA: choice-of-anchor X domain-containing protein [Myxococcota bacterium]|nr:choice-of-anchor X domain-containing protein [Myxococcota bacterium]